MPEVWRLTEAADLYKAARVLERAFEADPLVRYMLPDQQDRARRLPWYFEANVRHAALFGEVWATQASEGVAAWLTPDGADFTEEQLKQSGLIELHERLGAVAARRFMAAVEVPLPETPGPYWYLLMLGVLPEGRRAGLATRLLTPMLERAGSANHRIRLETNNPDSLPFYAANGFTITGQAEIAAGVGQWALEWAPHPGI